MANAARAGWRRYRSLPAKGQLAIAFAVVVLVVVAAAVGGSSSKPASHLVAGATTTSSSSTPSTAAPAVQPSPTTAGTVAATTAVTASPGAPGICHVRGTGEYVLPDPACTPGATNPEVTQADIGSTVCASGWTATIRPPESYTEPLKIAQMAAYGETGPVGSYEEDHLISLELGGAPSDPRNLWPEPGASPNPKDKVENAARAAVCDGRMSLVAAQQAIAANWMALGQQLGVATATTPSTVAAAVTTAPATVPPSVPTAGCSPKTAGGNCYRAGEYCPKADQGMTGTDASGRPITCEDVSGTWRWE